jgi:hypothetical protein
LVHVPSPVETAPGQLWRGRPGTVHSRRRQTTPALSSMAKGCLRSLKVISENPLIPINEFEKMTDRTCALPLEYQCGSMRRGRTHHELAHVLGRAAADFLTRQTQLAHRKANRREAHAARDIRRLGGEMQPVG